MAEIKKITIEVGGKKIDMTPDEAKEMKRILNDLFGDSYPIFIERYRDRWPYPHWTYTTTGTTGNLTFSAT